MTPDIAVDEVMLAGCVTVALADSVHGVLLVLLSQNGILPMVEPIVTEARDEPVSALISVTLEEVVALLVEAEGPAVMLAVVVIVTFQVVVREMVLLSVAVIETLDVDLGALIVELRNGVFVVSGSDNVSRLPVVVLHIPHVIVGVSSAALSIDEEFKTTVVTRVGVSVNFPRVVPLLELKPMDELAGDTAGRDGVVEAVKLTGDKSVELLAEEGASLNDGCTSVGHGV